MERKSKIRTLAVVVFAIGIVFSTMMFFPGGDHRKWTVLGAQIVDDPTLGDNSGICGFYIFETGSTYTSNLTSGTGGYLAGGSAINATNLDMPHSTATDLILWARFNDTDSGLDIQFARGNLSWVGNITADQAPDHIYVTATSAKFMYVNFVWDNSNAGYTINRNQKDIPIDNINITGYK